MSSTAAIPPRGSRTSAAAHGSSIERNSLSQKQSQGKSRSKERRSVGPIGKEKSSFAPADSNSQKNLMLQGGRISAQPAHTSDSLSKLEATSTVNNGIYSNQIQHHNEVLLGSGQKAKRTPGHQQRSVGFSASKNSQTQLQIPHQRPIYRLLQTFKLQQYAKSFIEHGFNDDIYKLAMITHRKKQELLSAIDLLPGHKQRFIDLFKRIDHMYPRQNVQRTLDNALRVSSKHSGSRMSGATSSVNAQTTTQDSSINVSSEKQGTAPRESVSTAQTINHAIGTPLEGHNRRGAPLLNTQPVNLANQDYSNLNSGIPLPTAFGKKVPIGERTRSPPSNSKQQRRPNNQQNSLVRKYNSIDQGTRTAINDSFLQNIKSGKSQVTTVQDALKEFYGKDTQTKQTAINKIFGTQTSQRSNNIKPHHSLAQAILNNGNQGQIGAGLTGGFGLQKFVKVQKGTNVIDKYRSQISSQGSVAKTQQKKRQNSRAGTNEQSATVPQPTRRLQDKKIGKNTKNSNSSNDSKKLLNSGHAQLYRKGSHPPAASRKKNTSNSSERKEGATFGLLAGGANKQVPQGARAYLQTQQAQGRPFGQNHQQRVTSHTRIQQKPSSNFQIAPNSSRGDFTNALKTATTTKAGQNPGSTKNSGSQLVRDKNSQPTGRTRLHRVRSAAGCKDLQQQPGPNTVSNNSNALNDYSSNSGAKKGQKVTTAQQAARQRVQLHRQRSATKQLTNTQDERQSTQTAKKQKPPTSSNTATSGSAIPSFINNSSASNQSRQPKQPVNRRQISRDRAAQLDVGGATSIGSITDQNSSLMHLNSSTAAVQSSGTGRVGTDTQDTTTNSNDNGMLLGRLKRANSQGASNIDLNIRNSQRSRDGRHNTVTKSFINNNNTGGSVNQSQAFTEPKNIRTPGESNKVEPKQAMTLPAITSTVKRVNEKVELLDNNACSPSKLGKPPMSHSGRRSTYSAKSMSLKTVESVHNSPEKPKDGGGKLTDASSKRPFALDPITNPPNLDKNDSQEEEESEYVMPVDPPTEPEETINYEEIKIKWTPLLDKQDKIDAREYGYSFGSKKVAMGPGFINLRFMCHCLARAIKRHLDFSRGEHWFLQDLQQEQDNIDLEFSYQLPPDLKLTLNPKGVRVGDDDEDEANPFQREDNSSPIRDIETMDIEVEAANKNYAQKSSRESLKNRPSLGLGEPEPESVTTSPDVEDKARINSQFSNNKPNLAGVTPVGEDEIGEDDFDQYSQDEDQQEEDPEEQSIKDIRKEEMRKSVFEKDEKRLNEYLNQRKVSELEQKLKSKDKQIQQLTKLVKNGNVIQEVMAISPDVDLAQQQEDEDGIYEEPGIKMDRAEWLMAQVDLDPIESHGSMEMSTSKFKSLAGKRYLNSDGNRVNNDAQEDSKTGDARSGNVPASAIREKLPSKKSAKSYESAYVDVSQDKMRDFAMSQLRHFDVRMEYDNLIFNEDQFVPMPSEKYIADYCKYVTIACKMENEIPIVCLVYIETLLLTTGILLNKWNWRRIVLICLTLASKIWDDDSLENVHFPKVMSDVTNYEINKLEQLFLEFIDYKLVIRGGEYAKYYFILRSLADDIRSEENVRASQIKAVISPFENTRRNQKSSKEEWAEFPLRAMISAEKMIELQHQEAKAEVYLKERHEREFLNAYIGNQPGSRKDQTRHPSLLLDRTM